MQSQAKSNKDKQEQEQGQGQGRQQAKQGCVERVSRVERRNAITSTNKAAAVHPMGSPSSALQPSVPAVPCERAGEDQGLAQAPPSAADHSTGAEIEKLDAEGKGKEDTSGEDVDRPFESHEITPYPNSSTLLVRNSCSHAK